MINAPEVIRDESGIALFSKEQNLYLRWDFMDLLPRINKGGLKKEMLIRACGLKDKKESEVSVIDATAGLGGDSFILSAAGFKVTMLERDPLVYEILYDAVKRAETTAELCDIAKRMHPVLGDSQKLLVNLKDSPDIIYLDPMFPERKKSGLVKKKLQMLKLLEKPCEDEIGLFFSAVNAKPKKIVIKRPAKGECLAGKKPDYSINGNTIRFDCYVNLGGFINGD